MRREAWRLVPFVLYAAYSAARSDLRIEHLLMIAAVAAFVVTGPRTRELLQGLYPFALVGLVYDAMRPFQRIGLTESRVLACDLRAVEARFFGSGGNTVHDFFSVHHAPALDLLSAIPYATFIAWCVAGAVFMYVKDRPAMLRFAWGFLALNVMGFITYHAIPAAPPWYVHEHGCVVDLATLASEGPALARVDAMLGISYFHGMYSKAASVFGALPSLHCAYPMLLVIEGWRSFGRTMRVASVAYWIAMVFSAVYLDHHWVLDALLGTSYAVIVSFAMRLPKFVAVRRAVTA